MMNPASTVPVLDSPALLAPSQDRVQRFIQSGSLLRLSIAVGLLLILGFGALIRIYITCTYAREGQDEHLYAIYVNTIQPSGGITHYQKVIAMDVDFQKSYSQAFVPATRIGFIWPAYLCLKLFGVNPLQAVRIVSCVSSILLLLLSAMIGWQIRGALGMLGLTALMSTAPLHVYLAQRSLIDGYFAFWAVMVLWLMWQNLRINRHWGWLSAYGISLTMLVLTKESAVFVFLALLGVLLLSRPLRLGQASFELIALTFFAPLLAVAILCALLGGVSEFFSFFQLLVARNQVSDYAIATQDGPWYRYLLDFLLISPLVVVLAIGALFQLRRYDQFNVIMASFLGFSFFVMAWIHYGVSLRFAAYWDVPLRWLALTQLLLLIRQLRKANQVVALTAALALVCASDLWQYQLYFVKGKLYDPITTNLVYAAGLTKKIAK